MFKELKVAWKVANTAEKIGFVIDILCGTGVGLVAGEIGDKLAANHTKLGKAVIKLATFGVTLAAGEAGSRALKENYGNMLGEAWDRAKARREAEAKEEQAHE